MSATAISLVLGAAGVALLLLLSLRYGFAGAPRLESDTEAVAIAGGLTGGFDAKLCVMDRDGHGALLIDDTGKGAVIMPHGANFIARLLSDEAQLSRDGTWLKVHDTGWKASLSLDNDCDLAMLSSKLGT